MKRRKRILIVDDEEQVAWVLSDGLKKLGEEYEIFTAHNGREALTKIKEMVFDLIITDLKMPGMDGAALTEVAYTLAPGTRIIWLTAYDHWEADAQRLAVYRYLRKPLDMQELRQAAREALATVPEQMENGKPQNRKHILIVDDDPQEALALCRALDEQPNGGYYVKITLEPQEALSSLGTEHFDLIAASLHAAEPDHLNLMRQVRQIAPNTRTLLITDHCPPEIEKQARQFAAACLPGPLAPAEFAQAIQRVLE